MTTITIPHDLIVIRHGETDWNAAARLQGREDVPLNDRGRGQARRNGTMLKAHFAARAIDPAGYDFVASPLSRATETMRLVREAAGLDPLAFRTDERLVEIDFGRWSGLKRDEIEARDPAEWLRRGQDNWNHVPPGGESSAMAVARLATVLTAIERPTVLVTHGGVNRVMKVLLGALTIEDSRGFHTPQDRFYVWADGKAVWI